MWPLSDWFEETVGGVKTVAWIDTKWSNEIKMLNIFYLTNLYGP